MRSKLSALEIAEILGVPKRTVNRWIKKENWNFVHELERGVPVKKYVTSLLPEKRLQALEEKHIENSSSTIQPIIVETEDTRDLSSLKNWQREIMYARHALFREFQRLEEKYGTNQAIDKFTARVKTGALQDYLQKNVKLANARKGKNGRTISASTIYRWKDMAKQGLIGFAPKETEKKEIPPWVPHFLKCYQIPTKPTIPEAMETMEKILPENIAMPTYSQVLRFHKKRSKLDSERGRKTGSALKAHKGYRKRDTSNLKPLDVGVCDGHSFKSKVAHPFHGKPFKPEVCAVIDVRTKMVIGWSAGLAESALTVADAVRHAATTNKEKPYGGVLNILYTDGGSGNKAKHNTDEITGIFTRLGTTHKTGITGNAQARGIIERLNKSLWIRSAKQLPTFVGKEMDKLTARNISLLMDKEIKKTGRSTKLISWPRFLEFCEQQVDAYNRRPHSTLPKINDPETGFRRNMAPIEYWAFHIHQGWDPKDHQLSEQEIEDLFLPRMERIVVRASVSLFSNTYFNKALEHYEGERVQVGYDIHDGTKVQVRDREDRLICFAFFEKNRTNYFPMSQLEKARNDRAKRRAQIKLNQLDDIEAERRGLLDIEPMDTKVIDIKALSPKIKVDREELQKEMTASVKTIPMDDRGKYKFWCELDSRLIEGKTLDESEIRFYEAYRNTRSFRAFKSVEEDLMLAQR